jgi:hypothetical protein
LIDRTWRVEQVIYLRNPNAAGRLEAEQMLAELAADLTQGQP